MSLDIKTLENCIDLINQDNRIVATIWTFNLDDGYKMALQMAAANELLDSLEAIIERWDTPLWKDAPNTGNYINAARLVVAKAKGEQFPQPSKKTGGDPCGECHLQAGETCDICGAIAKAKGDA